MGVDVFFVISGYLITSLIAREASTGTFSFSVFWMRRVRRLFPALAVMALAVFLFAYFEAFETEIRSLGAQMTSLVLLVANIKMWRQSGYWGPTAEDIPLLHTWSLAVEEQFYLIFPAIAILALRIKRKAIQVALLGSLFIGSLALCILMTPSQPDTAFYLLPFRAWELLLGAVIAFRQLNTAPDGSQGAANALSLAGLIALLAAYFSPDASTNFPGWKAMLPVLGTGSLILSLRHTTYPTPIRTLLQTAPMAFIGKISYSLYLWHWPLILILNWLAFPSTPQALLGPV